MTEWKSKTIEDIIEDIKNARRRLEINSEKYKDFMWMDEDNIPRPEPKINYIQEFKKLWMRGKKS